MGASSRDIRLTGRVDVVGDAPRIPLTLESTLAEVLADPVAGPLVAEGFSGVLPLGGDGHDTLGVDMFELISSVPIGRMVSFTVGRVTREQLEQVLRFANESSSQ